VLGEAGFVKLTREATEGRPRTWVAITADGKKALRKEINALRKILSQIDAADAGKGSRARDSARH
jgi:DNA-binding PadR family transcriptional regulator